jgi:DNA helicase HerA-like ATPase
MLIGQRHRFVTEFAEALYRDNRAPLHLVIDEADEFAPQNPLPETKRMLHHVDRIVRRGRVRGFRVMLITQRPAVLHKNVLTQANALIAMRLTAPQDRKAMQAWVEGKATPARRARCSHRWRGCSAVKAGCGRRSWACSRGPVPEDHDVRQRPHAGR